MGKFTDDVSLEDEGMVQPPSAQLLIRALRVEQADKGTQSQALTRWLAKNNPGPSLERSLRRHGFGELLKKQGRPVSRRATA